MSGHGRNLLAACAVLVLAVAGCGGSDDEPEGAKLPESSVAQLNVRLDEIQRRFDAAQEPGQQGACEDIQDDSFPAVKRLLDGLPEDVDGKLRDATESSFARLQQLVDDGCSDIPPPETETETETVPPETETVPPQTETVPPQTETVPPPTTPQQTTPDNGGSGGTDPDGTGGGGTQAPEDDDG